MSDPSLSRPSPSRSVGDVVRERVAGWRDWVGWVGPVRLVSGVVVAVVSGSLVFLLVRPAAPPTESLLPVVSVAPAVSVAPVVPVSSVPSSAPVSVVVHVAGSVRAPGVYRLDPTARVADAVGAAGGPGLGADLDGVNLAAPLVDGERVYVPAVGEVDPRTVPSRSDTRSSAAAAGPVDLNRATVDELDALPGIGPSTASAIVDDRDANGPFTSVDDLVRVPGIGPAKLGALRDLVVV